MKMAVNSLLSLIDASTGFCYWLLGRDLLEEEINRIKDLFSKVNNPEDETLLIEELNRLSPGKDLLLICDARNYNLVQWCILNNYAQALLFLLEYGCNPSRTGIPKYDLPLALACCLKQFDTVKILLDYGANPYESTILSPMTLKYLSQENNQERFSKLNNLLQHRDFITPLSIVLTFDDLSMFRLLMGDKIRSPSVSGSSPSSSSSSISMMQTIETPNIKTPEIDFDLFHDKLKTENYADHMPPMDAEESNEQHQQQQNISPNDDLSEYADHRHFFSFYDSLDAEYVAVNNYDGRQALSEKGNQVERINQEETFAPAATTDGGYYTVDGSSGRVKSQAVITAVDRQKLNEVDIEENIRNLCISIRTDQLTHQTQSNKALPRTKSQQQLTKLSNNSYSMHRRSLPNNVYYQNPDHPSKRFRSTSSLLLSNMPRSTKQITYLLRLLYQMIEYEAAIILEYFLKIHQDEFNDHFQATANCSDVQLKTFELLSNIKSDRIYNVLLSSNSAYFDQVTTSLCDRENNTLVHALLGQNPLRYEPNEMIKMVERYLTCGLNEFINRPNLSNLCMIQILLCNEHFLKMCFFSRCPESSLKPLNLSAKPMAAATAASVPMYDPEIVEKWRHSYLILIEILIKHGSRIDISSGSYRNSFDCLLSKLVDLAKHVSSVITATFDMKYLKRLIITLFASLNQTKTRPIHFKYNIERFIQLLYFVHIDNDHLSDTLSIIHLLLQYEYQPLKLNKHTLINFFKLWLTYPNFLCSNLIAKDLFMQEFLSIIVRRFSISNQSNDNPLLLSTSAPPLISPNHLSRRPSLTSNDNEVCLQNLLSILLNLLSLSQTCLQIHSIYELILVLVNHATFDIVNYNDLPQLPLVYLCLQTKLVHTCLLIPFIDLFKMIHSFALINKTKDTLSQIPMKRLSIDLYKHFSKNSVRSLRHISSKYLYHHLRKPFIDSVNSLPIGDTLKKQLIHFHDI